MFVWVRPTILLPTFSQLRDPSALYRSFVFAVYLIEGLKALINKLYQ